MKRIHVQALVAGGYRLVITDESGAQIRWRSDTRPIPTVEEAQTRAATVADALGYRHDKRVRHPAAPTNPTPKEDPMGDDKASGTLAKGTAVKIVAANLKEKRAAQLEPVLRKTGTVIRFLNGRYFVAFDKGETKWWLAENQVKAVEAKADEAKPEPEAKAKKAKPKPTADAEPAVA